MRLRLALSALMLSLVVPGAAQVHAQDAPPPAPPPPPTQEQLDAAALAAFEATQSGRTGDVLEGLDQLARVRSSVVTEKVVDLALGRSEQHVAEFAGCALAAADPEGALDAVDARLRADRIPAAKLAQLAAFLSEIPTPRALDVLASDRLLGSRDERVRREAIRALGTQRSPRVVDAAIAALGSRDAALRNTACVALGRVGDARAVTPLLGALDKNDGGTAGFAAIALGRIEDDSIVPTLAARLGSGNSVDKAKAFVAAARPAHVDRIAAMVRSGSDDAKIAACAAAAKLELHDLELQKALLQEMLGNDRWVRAAAFHALGRCATPELSPFLEKRTGQKDEERLRYVFEIAGDIQCTGALEALEKSIWNERDPITRRVAMDAFWRVRDPDAITRAEAHIRASAGRAFERAAEFVGLRHNRNGFDLALELLDGTKPDSAQQLAVEFALEKQTGHFFGRDTALWREWIDANKNFFEKEQAQVERAKWREDFLKENTKPGAVTPDTERAVQAALDYLARHQDPSGAFDQQHFLDLCSEPACSTDSGARVQMDPVGVTALCALAYYGAGCSPAAGRYRGVLSRAMEYLLSRQMADGDYAPNDLIGGYNRPLALQAYAEAYAATHDAGYVPFVQRGVDFLTCIQAAKGGWRYRVVDNANDSSVVAWVLFAAKSAEKAGARVRRSVFEGCDLVLAAYQMRPVKEREDFYRDIDPNYAFEVGQGTTYEFHTGYQNANFEAKYATTALGLMSRILLGLRRSHPFSIGSANKLLAAQLPEIPKDERWDRFQPRQEYPMYHMYYGTLAMHQMGGKYFRDWNKSVKAVLLGTQETGGCSAGSWSGWNSDRFFSRLYPTALGALTLETYYRYAPVLQD